MPSAWHILSFAYVVNIFWAFGQHFYFNLECAFSQWILLQVIVLYCLDPGFDTHNGENKKSMYFFNFCGVSGALLYVFIVSIYLFILLSIL